MGILSAFDRLKDLDELAVAVDVGSGVRSIAQRQANAQVNLGLASGTPTAPPTPGTASANQAVVLGANKNVDTMEIDTLNVGASGTAGTLKVFPGAATTGDLKIVATANTGNTETTITNVAFAQASTLTIPDPKVAAANFLLTGATQGTNGMVSTRFPMFQVKNNDGTTLATAASAGKFGLAYVSGTSMVLNGEAASLNTKTDDAAFELVLPPNYVAGQNITVTVNAQTVGAGTLSVKTLGVSANKISTAGAAGANLGPVTQNLTGAATDLAYTITGATLNPGDVVAFKVETVLTETAGVSTNAQVNSIRVS